MSSGSASTGHSTPDIILVKNRITWDIKINSKGNHPPVAVGEAEPNPAKSFTTVELSGENSYDNDPEDSITNYEWKKTFGPNIGWSSATGEK